MAESQALRPVHVAALDDTLLRALTEQKARSAGWRVTALDAAAAPDPDAIVILDLDQPAERLEALRASGFAGPVLVLGGAGAAALPEDEPIARPVRLGTLLARIDAHWAEPVATGCLTFGPYLFVPGERVLRDDATGAVIRLTELERSLLSFLAAAEGGLIDRDQLLERVWGYNAGADTHTVETHIWRLRQKIETDDPTSRILVTEAGGYRLLLAGSEQAG